MVINLFLSISQDSIFFVNIYQDSIFFVNTCIYQDSIFFTFWTTKIPELYKKKRILSDFDSFHGLLISYSINVMIEYILFIFRG